MGFYTADYDAYVVLGDPDAAPLWNWKVWQRFLPAIDPLIHAARGKPAVRSIQYAPDRADVVRFGRLGWKEVDHQKWCHDSPANKHLSQSWGFLSLEVWAPAWTLCERENLAPDVFLSIRNESLGAGHGKDLLFNPVIIFAVVSTVAQRQRTEVGAAVSALRELTSAELVGYMRRPWGKPFGSAGFTNAIQDLAVSGLFKPGPRHQGELGFHLFADEWKTVSFEKTGL